MIAALPRTWRSGLQRSAAPPGSVFCAAGRVLMTSVNVNLRMCLLLLVNHQPVTIRRVCRNPHGDEARAAARRAAFRWPAPRLPSFGSGGCRGHFGSLLPVLAESSVKPLPSLPEPVRVEVERLLSEELVQ